MKIPRYSSLHCVSRSPSFLDGDNGCDKVSDELLASCCVPCYMKITLLPNEAQIMRYKFSLSPRVSSFINTSSCLARFHEDVILERQREFRDWVNAVKWKFTCITNYGNQFYGQRGWGNVKGRKQWREVMTSFLFLIPYSILHKSNATPAAYRMVSVK
jgi:hypothetical protein